MHRAGLILPMLLLAGLLLTPPVHAFPPIDLTTASATFTGSDGVIWNQVAPPAGVLNSYLRVQNTGIEEGFNSDGAPDLDEVAGTFTRSLLLGDMDTRSVMGSEYYVFSCDINETIASNLLSLDELRIFTSNYSGVNTISDLLTMESVSTLRYDMDASGDQTVYLNYALNSGSGAGDFQVLVPKAFFAGAALTDNLILYGKFGAAGGGYASSDGFEEWFTTGERQQPSETPEPSSLLLFGGAALGLVAGTRRRA